MENENKNMLEEIINDPNQVERVIYAINLGVEIPYPHNPNSYFLTGHCNIYSLILLEVFNGYAIPYDSKDHVVTKIGDNYYDVEGLANWKVEDSNFRETYKEFLLEPMMSGVGNYTNGTDDKIIEDGAKAGKSCIRRMIEKKIATKGQSSVKM
jgi:hypothetical protein